jgi:hypothetical protein
VTSSGSASVGSLEFGAEKVHLHTPVPAAQQAAVAKCWHVNDGAYARNPSTRFRRD